MEFRRKDFGVEMPPLMEEALNQLEQAIHERALHVDCIQDEIRSLAHGYTDLYWTEETAEEIIDYYCRRRWF